MFPRSRSIYFADPPPWRGSLAPEAGELERERHSGSAAQYFRNAVSVPATVSIFGGVLVYLIVG
jgi:hypothetical protein